MYLSVCVSTDVASLVLIKYWFVAQRRENYCFFLIIILILYWQVLIQVECVSWVSGSSIIWSPLHSWWQLLCLLRCQSPLKITNTRRQCCSYIFNPFELLGVRGIRSHFTEAVSHQCVLNEICLLGFSILLTVIILVSTEAFNKGALPSLDCWSNNRIASSLSEHSARSPHKLNMIVFLCLIQPLLKGMVWVFHFCLNHILYRKERKKKNMDLTWRGKSHVQCKAMASNCVDSD